MTFCLICFETKPDSSILPRLRQPASELSTATGDVQKRNSLLKTEHLSNFILKEAAAVYFGLIGFGCSYLLKEIQFSFSILGVVPLVIFMDFINFSLCKWF